MYFLLWKRQSRPEKGRNFTWFIQQRLQRLAVYSPTLGKNIAELIIIMIESSQETLFCIFFLGTPISISYPDFLMFFQPLRLTSTRSRAGALGPAWCGLSPCRAYGPRRRQGQDAWSKFVSYVWKIQSLWMEKCSLKQKNDRQRADLGGKSPRAWMITSGRPV